MLRTLTKPVHLCALSGTIAYFSGSNKSYAAEPIMNADHMKKLVGYTSVDKYVKSNMKVGLGTGSTAFYAVERLGQKLKSGELSGIVCVPTSEKTAKQAKEWNIPLTSLDDLAASIPSDEGAGDNSSIDPHLLDVTIDGADEVELASFAAIKGGGGALLREKMVEKASKRFVCIVDESKCITVKGFGSKFPIPIEIIQFNHQMIMKQINEVPALKLCGCQAVLRRNADSTPYVTDNGNYIADLHCTKPILASSDSTKLLKSLNSDLYNITGLVEHGLFINMVDVLIIAHKDQTIEILENNQK